MTYFKRTDWGAKVVPRGERMDARQVVGLALHWPGDTQRRETVPEVMAALRGWQELHVAVNRWRDIAYQEAVDQAGNVYRLRGLRVVSAANGDTEPNQRYGAVLLVLGIGEDPSPAMVETLRKVVARQRLIYPRATQLVPHSAIRPEPTACPGDKVRALIASGLLEPRGHRR